MGSSPVTATMSSRPALARLDQALAEGLAAASPELAAGDGVLVAFSGGTDSLALLLALTRLGRRLPIRVVAAHLDHAIDDGSAARCAAAAALAAHAGATFVAERHPVSRRRHGLEAAAREERYAFLERQRILQGCRLVATAHHADDQTETVALRLLFGSGLAGLAGIRPRRDAVVRPLLAVPRALLAAAVAEAGLRGVVDPTNDDRRHPRNRLRHAVLPRLERSEPGVGRRLGALAAPVHAANLTLDARLRGWLDPSHASPRLPLARLRRAPPALRHAVLAVLHRASGRALPPPAGACAELLRQLDDRGRVGCDCGPGLRWLVAEDCLFLAPADEPRATPFTYTFSMPGRVTIPEIGSAIELRREPVAPWMRRGEPRRTALRIAAGASVSVRSRRPGDRLRPLGAAGTRRLKDVLIDAKVPRAERDRLPLLCVDERIAWVPGVAIDDRFRVGAETETWVAEIHRP